MKNVFLFILLNFIGSQTFSQVDFTGDWDHPGLFGHEDVNDRGQGPELGDYLGLPLNAAGLRKAESFSGSWLSVPEHQCTPHPAAYQTWGPNTLVVNKMFDPTTKVLTAIRLDGTFGLDRVVWMDGRPHPGPEALHTFNGFSTGHWDGDTLVVETTHVKTGWLRRNGTATSEKMQMTEFYQRFDDYLLVTTIIDDPVYLSEPFVRTTEYELVARTIPVIGFPFTRNDGPTFYRCFPSEETTSNKYYVPHYLPDQNPLLEEFSGKYHVPLWAMESGAAAMYPEFSARIESDRKVKEVPDAVAVPDKEQPVPGLHTVQVRDRIWLITGAGGNITVQVGDEGILVVDTGLATMADEVRDEIRRIGGNKPIRYVINTHWHADHTGGNVLLSDETGQRAAILAHENVGLRLAEADAEAGLLVMDTYYGDSKVLYFNGEAIEIIKVPDAHTDSDSIVFFRGSDVISAGDIIMTDSFPRFIADEGGSVEGVIDALNRILDITVAEYRSQGGTLVIPGHGRLYDETDVAEYRDMLTILRDRVRAAVDAGDRLAVIKKSNPLLDYSGVFGSARGDWSNDRFVEAMYQDLGGK